MAQAPSTDAHAAHDPNVYFVPHSSRWPLYASVALFITMVGFSGWLNEAAWGRIVFLIGIAGLVGILFKWFADVITESVRSAERRVGKEWLGTCRCRGWPYH